MWCVPHANLRSLSSSSAVFRVRVCMCAMHRNRLNLVIIFNFIIVCSIQNDTVSQAQKINQSKHIIVSHLNLANI